MSSAARKRLSAIAVISIAALALLFYWSALVVVTFRIPQTGVSATCNERACWRIVRVQPGTSAARAGLRNGDVVVYAKPGRCSPGLFKCRPFRLFSGNPVPQFQLAHPLILSVQRGTRHFYVIVNPAVGDQPYPIADALTFIFRLLVYTGFILLGVWLALLRPGLMAWAFFATCVSLAAPRGLAMLTYVEVFQHGAPLDTFYNIDFAFQLGIIALPIFLLCFPTGHLTGRRRQAVIFALWVAPCVYLLAFFLNAYDYLTQLPLGEPIGELPVAVSLLSLGIVVTMYVYARGSDRKRLQWAIAGMIAALAASLMINSISLISLVLLDWQPLGVLDRSSLVRNVILDIAGLLYALMPICIIYAIIKHRVIDVRFVASRGIVIGMMLLLFAGVFAGLDWLFSAYVYQSQAQIAIGMALAFGLGWLIRSRRTACVDFVDRIFFPKHHVGVTEMRALRLALERETSDETVREVVTNGAAAALQLASAAVFSHAADGGFIRETAVGWGSGTAWHLLADDPIVKSVSARPAKAFRIDDVLWDGLGAPPGVASPTLAIPLISHRKVVALLFYGAHTTGADIDPDEERLLIELCAVAAPAFDHRETSRLPSSPAFAADATRLAR